MLVAIPWYDCDEDFREMAALLPFEESRKMIAYRDWAAKIPQLEKHIEQEGNTPRRIKITPAIVKAWTKANGRELNRQTIKIYAMAVMASTQL